MQFLKKVESDKGPKAIGPYSPAVKLGDFVFLSGQLGMDAQGNLISDDVEEQTDLAMKNIGYLLEEMNLEYRHITKTTVFVSDLNDFSKVNDIYGSYFDGVYPARSCVEVSKLPKDAKVEIECIVLDTLAYEQQMENQQCGCGGCSDGGCGDDGCNDSGCGNDGCCGGSH